MSSGQQELDYVDRLLAKIPGMGQILGLEPELINREPRNIYFNSPLPAQELLEDGSPKHVYASNKIRTTKYTAMTFVPRNLTLQFKSVANIFFLYVAITGSFRIFGLANGGLAAVPIICIIVITAIRDAYEDYRRFLLDREFNNALTYCLLGVDNPNVNEEHVGAWRSIKKASSRALTRVHRFIVRKPMPNYDLKSLKSRQGRSSMQTARSNFSAHTSAPHADVKFKQQFWKQVQVGSVIKILANESVPADVVILSTSEEDGSCFIETKNLDGETMLKPRLAAQNTRHLQHAHQLAAAHLMAEVEGANSNLDTFGWALHDLDSGNSDALAPINLIPRGASLKNTKYAVGLVVYTGRESKIIMNAGETPRKRSKIAKDLNFYVYISFAFLAVCAIISTVVQRVKFGQSTNTWHFFEYGLTSSPISLNSFVNFIASIQMFQNFIPISLYISIEIVKTIQAWFIYSDNQLWDEETGERCTPKTWNIGDDLGQVEFIFSDKTGTLTQNSMVFRKCTVQGKSYGVAFTEAQAGAIIRGGGQIEQERAKAHNLIAQETRELLELRPQDKYASASPEFVSAEIYRDLPHNETLRNFVLCIALCNTVVPEHEHGRELVHKSESPDETSLVSTARDLGYTLVESPKHWKYVHHQGRVHKFRVLETLYFTSDRKRMTTLVEDETGNTFVYSKGADVIIRDRLADPASADADWANLEQYGDEGLRTLLLAYKQVDSAWAREWCERHAQAVLNPDRERLIAELADELEHSLLLLGGTGIEDKLQQDVPDTIHKLGAAGIKLWVLTGDKPETAISIGYSCALLEPQMELLRVESPQDVGDFLAKFGLSGTPQEIKAAAANHAPAPSEYALVIDGKALEQILEDQDTTTKFALLGKQCKSVLCCRVSPSQKAAVVGIIKSRFDVTALAVGDGANDVPMIQRADIGVGIVGVEGRQASMSADYAIGKFRFLQRLVLVHGHWSYARVCNLVGILLYKNIVFTMCLFWNGIFNQFDNSYVCDYSLIVLYNSVFTSTPVIMAALFDQDVPDRVLLASPSLYAKGILRGGWTRWKFVQWSLEGIYQSAVIYFLTWCNFHGGEFVSVHGIPAEYLQAIGVYVISASVLTVNLEVMIVAKNWDVVLLLFEFLSLVVMLAFICIYTALTSSRSFYGAYYSTYGTIPFWASTLLTTFLCLAPRIYVEALRNVFKPEPLDIARQQAKNAKHQRSKSATKEEQQPEKV